MNTVDLSNKLVLGTAQFGLNYGISNQIGKPSRGVIFEILDRAKSFKLSMIDTAASYGDALEIIGEYQRLRNSFEFQIFTKVNLDTQTESFSLRLNENLKRLNVSSIHGCYLHSFTDLSMRGVRLQIQNAKKQEKITFAGVSVYTTSEILSLVDDKEIDIIQIPFNLFDQSVDKLNAMRMAKESGKRIIVRSIFLQGLFFMNLKYIPDHLKVFVPSIKRLKLLAREWGMTVESICLAFVLHTKYVDHAIVGVDSLPQLQANIDASGNVLSDEQIQELRKLGMDVPQLDPRTWRLT